MGQGANHAKGRAETRPYVVAAVYVSTVGFVFGVVFGRGEVVLLALAILIALLACSTRVAAEALEECLPLVAKSTLLLPPLAVVLVGLVLLGGGVLINRAWVMVAGTAITALGVWFCHYLVAKVGFKGALNAIAFALIGWSGPIHPRRKYVNWGDRWVLAKENDERFYRIEGLTGTGKSHLTRLFILEALKELERNPYAKMIIYEPKREFYAWLKSMGLPHPVHYFMPSDQRGEPLHYGMDFATEQDAKTLAHAFWPHDPGEKARFWGDCMRAIFAAVYLVILEALGHCDLRLVLAVMEDFEDTRTLLSCDPYQASAQILVAANGGSVNEAIQNIQLSIHSRVAEMKTMASHLHHAAQDKDAFSLREFIHRKKSSILVVSKDSDYKLNPGPDERDALQPPRADPRQGAVRRQAEDLRRHRRAADPGRGQPLSRPDRHVPPVEVARGRRARHLPGRRERREVVRPARRQRDLPAMPERPLRPPAGYRARRHPRVVAGRGPAAVAGGPEGIPFRPEARQSRDPQDVPLDPGVHRARLVRAAHEGPDSRGARRPRAARPPNPGQAQELAVSREA